MIPWLFKDPVVIMKETMLWLFKPLVPGISLNFGQTKSTIKKWRNWHFHVPLGPFYCATLRVDENLWWGHSVFDQNQQIDLNKVSLRKTLNIKVSFTPFIVQNCKTIFCKQSIVKQHIQGCEAQWEFFLEKPLSILYIALLEWKSNELFTNYQSRACWFKTNRWLCE